MLLYASSKHQVATISLHKSLIFLFPRRFLAIVSPMRNRVYTACLLLICLLGLSWRGGKTVVFAQDPASDIARLVNELRTGYGLPAFSYNPTLAAAAQNQANWMAATGIYSHTQSNGSTPQSRAEAVGYVGYVSENIVGGTQLSTAQGVVWWRNSAVHFNTMVATRYTQMGVGYASGLDQNFYVLVVGNPSDQPVSRRPAQANAAPVMVAPIVLSPPREDGSIVHQVLPGQTFWAIAARYEVPLNDIFLYNNLTENSLLKPGDELLIRLAEGQAPPPTPTPPATHIVREGDSAWSIAAWYNIGLADFLWYNNLTENDFLQPGEEVIIRLLPGQSPPPTATPPVNHVVAVGESLWTIAARHKLTLAELLAWNGLSENAVVHPGDELRVVPPATPTSEPTATPVPTNAPTATPTLAATPVAKTAVSPTPTTTPLALPATPVPVQTASAFSFSPITIGIGLLALGLTAVGGVAMLLLGKQGK